VVVCPETSKSGVEQLAQALRRDFDGHDIGVSMGAADDGLHGSSPEELLARADAAMYRQKQTGARRSEAGEAIRIRSR
ncbi:hypothetical protein LCGC14_3137000, partial [marine sediment metagenome]